VNPAIADQINHLMQQLQPLPKGMTMLYEQLLTTHAELTTALSALDTKVQTLTKTMPNLTQLQTQIDTMQQWTAHQSANANRIWLMIGNRAFDLTKLLEITVLAIVTAGFTGAFTAALIQHNPRELNHLNTKINNVQLQLKHQLRNPEP
jgi:cysteine synthase